MSLLIRLIIAALLFMSGEAYAQAVFDYNPPALGSSESVKRNDLDLELDGINADKADFVDIDTSAEWRAILTDEVGTGAAVFVGCTDCLGSTEVGALDSGDVTTGSFTDGRVNGANESDEVKPVEALCLAMSDETTDISTGTAKVTWRMPYAFTLTNVRASLNTVSSSGIPTVDINEAGSTIMTTNKLTIDASELTSVTAATAVGITDSTLADDAAMTADIDVAGTGAKGLKICLIGNRT